MRHFQLLLSVILIFLLTLAHLVISATLTGIEILDFHDGFHVFASSIRISDKYFFNIPLNWLFHVFVTWFMFIVSIWMLLTLSWRMTVFNNLIFGKTVLFWFLVMQMNWRRFCDYADKLILIIVLIWLPLLFCSLAIFVAFLLPWIIRIRTVRFFRLFFYLTVVTLLILLLVVILATLAASIILFIKVFDTFDKHRWGIMLFFQVNVQATVLVLWHSMAKRGDLFVIFGRKEVFIKPHVWLLMSIVIWTVRLAGIEFRQLGLPFFDG